LHDIAITIVHKYEEKNNFPRIQPHLPQPHPPGKQQRCTFTWTLTNRKLVESF